MSSNPGHPWSADRELTLETVRTILSESAPDLVGDVHFVGEGWDNQVFSIGDWMFRFPKRAEVVSALQGEFDTSAVLQKHVSIATPHFAYRCPPTVGFPYPFGGYTRVPGTPVDQLDRPISPSALPQLATDLARLLDEFASIDTSELATLSTEQLELEAVLDEAEAGFDLVEPHLSDDRFAAWTRFCEDTSIPAPHTDDPVFVHNDLFGDHLLVDDADRLVGVIDFADQTLGDPVLDLVGIAATFGLPFAFEVAQKITAWRLSHQDELRLIYLSAVMPMRWATNALQRGEYDIFDQHADLVDAAISFEHTD